MKGRNIKMADRKYANASLQAKEFFSNKVKNQLNRTVTDQGMRFMKLTSLIPNWATYLTSKQREAAIKYLSTMNAYEVDYQLKLTNGTTHQRLFGSKSSKGAIGRLEEVYKMLESNGHFAQQEKRQKEATESKRKQKIKLTEKTLSQIQELFKLIHENPDYEQYLTKPQIKKVNELLNNRSLTKGAKACGVTVAAYQRSLIGDKSVLEKLKSIRDSKTINSWEEI